MHKKTIFKVSGMILVVAFFIAGIVIGITKIGSFNRYFKSKAEFAELVNSEDVERLVDAISSDEDVIAKNEDLAMQAYLVIYESAKTEMKEGSIHKASKLFGVLPDDFENVLELKKKVDFYKRFDKKYTHAYSPYKLNIKINVDPDSKDVYVTCAEQPLLNAVISYGSTRVNNKGKNYSASFDMETCEYKLITNNHVSTRSGKYNH